MSKAEVKDLTTRPEAGALVDMSMFEGDLGQGFEDTSSSDYAIPFMGILQAMSPQCTMGKPQFNEDLRPGMFFNSVSEESYSGKDGILFVPSKYVRVGLLWEQGKNDGTGFRGVLPVAEMEALLPQCTKGDKGEDITPEGLVLVDTRQWYGLHVPAKLSDDKKSLVPVLEEPTVPVLITLKSTQLKKSKRWLSVAQGLRHNGKPLPLSSQVYRLTSVPESNDKGAWMGYEIKHVGTVPSMDIYQAAKDFRDMIDAGSAKANYEAEAPVAGDDVPF